jgi:ribokinase
MPWDIMTFGDMCADFILSGGDVVPEFGQKEKMIGSYALLLGGSAGIFACQCAKLGLKTAVAGKLGDDVFGRLIQDEMKGCGVDTRFISTDKEIKTGLTCILQADGDRAMLTVPGSIGAAAFADAADELRRNVRHVHVCSYYLTEQLRSGYPAFLREMRGFGATVSLDTNWDPAEKWDGLDALEGLVDVFLPNENEAAAFTRETDAERAMEKLARLFPVVAVKCGEKGAIGAAGGKTYRAGGLQVPFVDAVGAGDSFDGGFLWAWLNGRPMEECLRAGCFCGSMNVTARGGTAGQPRLETLLEGLR